MIDSKRVGTRGAALRVIAFLMLAACGEQTAKDGRLAPLSAQECERDGDCSDGVACTLDVCVDGLCRARTAANIERLMQQCQTTRSCDALCDQGLCMTPADFLVGRAFVTAPACAAGHFCDPLQGCKEGAICAEDADCQDQDPCTSHERCDPASRTCVREMLDGDEDGTIAQVCGGTDCDDGNARFPAREECNGIDDDCDGRVDEDFDLLADPDNCGACGNGCASGVCEQGACTACGELSQACCLGKVCKKGACTDGTCIERTCPGALARYDVPVCSVATAACIQQCYAASPSLCSNCASCEVKCISSDPNAAECNACSNRAYAVCEQEACAETANRLRCCVQDHCPDLQTGTGRPFYGCEPCRELQFMDSDCRIHVRCTGPDTVKAAECFPPR